MRGKRADEAMIGELFEVILKLETAEDCYMLFDDLCTPKEINSMAQRIRAAKLLMQNKTYEQIMEQTDMSSATLSRVSKCVNYGSGGYVKFLSKKDE